jgi:hypothetical protein
LGARRLADDGLCKRKQKTAGGQRRFASLALAVGTNGSCMLQGVEIPHLFHVKSVILVFEAHMDKEYTYKNLLDVFIETLYERGAWVEESVRDYYPQLLSHLEKAFGVSFAFDSIEDFSKKVLFMLFQSTVHSYKDLRHPWSNYQEATLLIKKLEDSGEAGKRILSLSDEIRAVTEASADLHLTMLYQLFECIYGPNNTVVTSEQLRVIGFDDSKEPKPWDFE